MTALIWAAGRGHTGVVRELLDGGARAEIADKVVLQFLSFSPMMMIYD